MQRIGMAAVEGVTGRPAGIAESARLTQTGHRRSKLFAVRDSLFDDFVGGLRSDTYDLL
jgi:hypothetical protein